jgi:hypothetical protein
VIIQEILDSVQFCSEKNSKKIITIKSPNDVSEITKWFSRGIDNNIIFNNYKFALNSHDPVEYKIWLLDN